MTLATRTQQYQPFPPVDLPDRRWPTATMTKPPIWCSVDLRDGNQALVNPMNPTQKLRLFQLLVKLGFKEIEIGFPSASQTDFDFCRRLIEGGLIPDDVTIQVLTQAREHLIRRTFEAVAGAKRVILHFYNATSTLQRRVVFQQDQAGIAKIAADAARLIKQLVAAPTNSTTEYLYQYSPESFTQTELDYSVDICQQVMDILKPTPAQPMILNLPATVEVCTPNVHADQIEWFCRHLPNRDAAIISLHPHNDRGTGVAATELGLLAGADRVEGTLFGNGERTGNVDIITLALNMHTQGMFPGLDFTDMAEVIRVAEDCTQIKVPERHPYAGTLVFTAFSGSHQDAIKKGLEAQRKANSEGWAVPYLPINPADLGRQYEPIIRINSQSGKGGVAFILEDSYGIRAPRNFQIEFSGVIQAITEQTGQEIAPPMIWEALDRLYLTQPNGRLSVLDYTALPDPHASEKCAVTAQITDGGQTAKIVGKGNGPIDAFTDALSKHLGVSIKVEDYQEHAIGQGSDTKAITFMRMQIGEKKAVHGVGLDANIVKSSLFGIVSAANRTVTSE
jgi:2-isopropylmalate synthase